MVPRHGRRRPRPRGEKGSAAVEFALCLPILMLLVFGIIDYGLFFNNSLALRQGIREGARQGVVGNFSETGCATSNELMDLVCKTNKQVGAITGSAYSKVVVSPAGWVKGNPLTVCSMVKTEGMTGLVPYPDGGWVRDKVQMSIESATAPTGMPSASNAPAGVDWTWCT